MTVFHFDDSNSVRSSPQKHNCPIEELQMLLTDYRQWKPESRSSVSSDSDVLSAEDSDDSEKADDIWDEEMLGDPRLGTGLLHDHCYTKRKTDKRVPSVSSECASEADESLQQLFDTCDIDRDFLAEATLSHSHFLEDVLDIDDVPADDFLFFDIDETSTTTTTDGLVPVKASSTTCLTIASASPSSSSSSSSCIFTSAGSTDTVLSTRVAGLTSYNAHRALSSPPSTRVSCCRVSTAAGYVVPLLSASVSEESSRVQVPLFDFSSSSSSSSLSSSSSCCSSSSCSSASTVTSFSSDFPSRTTTSFTADLIATTDSSLSTSSSSSLDSKLKDVIDFLFSPTAAAPEPVATTRTSQDVTSFLEEMDNVRCRAAAAAATSKSGARQPPLSFSDSDDSVWPVTLSHRIQNGACVSCCLKRRQSATSDDESFRINNIIVDTVLACPTSTTTPPLPDAAATTTTTTHLQQLSQQQQKQHHQQQQQKRDGGDSSSSSSTTAIPPRSGKRKSRDTTDSSEERCSLYPAVCGKQPRLAGGPSSDEETDRDEALLLLLSPPSFPALSPAAQFHVPSPSASVVASENAECCDLSVDVVASSENVVVVDGLKKQSRKVYDFLSAFGASNTKLPLSPINANHFGRCG